MKIAVMYIILLTMLFPTIVHSGEIFGCIKLEKKLGNKLKKEFIGKGVTIEIKSEDKTQLIGTTETDEYGIYSIYLDREGQHIINMSYEKNGKKQPIYFMNEPEDDIAVRLSKESVQYDFIIEDKDGKYFVNIK
jgi:hypothetical protein